VKPHPRLFTVDVFRPTSRATAAKYLHEIADMLHDDNPPYNAEIEKIIVELTSDKDSPMAEVTIRMQMRNALGDDFNDTETTSATEDN